ncbi:formate dehydrogenase accessory sulfurtransferase FdhD [soil metagenome]
MDEAPVWISINGERRVMLTCSPTAIEALAVGHLIGEGWIEGVADVRSVRSSVGPGRAHGADVEIDDARVERAELLRRHRMEHGCGLRHVLDCTTLSTNRSATPSSDDTPIPDLADTFRALFAAADAAAEGGVHAAALCDHDGVLRYTSVDVARHCAVDRAIGQACLAGERPSLHGLVISSRISGAIAMKAANAGLRWIASRSIATPLAREIATAAGVALHEQAARRSQ